MKVIATSLGFYGGSRRRIGAEFDMLEGSMKKDAKGDAILPSWVVRASAEGRKRAAQAKDLEYHKAFEGAKASAGDPSKVQFEGIKPGVFDSESPYGPEVPDGLV
jgi:hypothetical protein